MRIVRDRGVTLLEMIVVIAILGTLLGLAVAFLKNANRDLGVAAAERHVVALVRAAQQAARADASPAWVVFDTKGGKVSILSRETIGQWHFEDPPERGAFGRDAKLTGASVVDARVGLGVRFKGSGAADCGELQDVAVDQGLALDLWFLRKSASGRGTLCSIGKEVDISVEGDGKVRASVGRVNASSGDLKVTLDTWCHLQCIWASGELKLFLNGIPVDTRPGQPQMVRGGRIVLGSTKGGFDGVVDEFRVSLVTSRDVYLLPAEVRVELPRGVTPAPDGRFVVWFDPEGRLDRVRHSDAVRFSLASPTDRKEVTISTGGSVCQTRSPAAPAPAPPKPAK